MVRDWETMRALLERFENESISDFVRGLSKEPAKAAVWTDEEREAFREEKDEQRRIVFGHLLLLLDAGYVEGLTVTSARDGFRYGFEVPRLTMAGHDALDALRSKTVWGWVKNRAVEHGIPITAELIKQALSATV